MWFLISLDPKPCIILAPTARCVTFPLPVKALVIWQYENASLRNKSQPVTLCFGYFLLVPQTCHGPHVFDVWSFRPCSNRIDESAWNMGSGVNKSCFCNGVLLRSKTTLSIEKNFIKLDWSVICFFITKCNTAWCDFQYSCWNIFKPFTNRSPPIIFTISTSNDAWKNEYSTEVELYSNC